MKDRLCTWIAFHLPHRVVYWCVLRAAAYATTTKEGSGTETPSIGVMTVLARWDGKQRRRRKDKRLSTALFLGLLLMSSCASASRVAPYSGDGWQLVPGRSGPDIVAGYLSMRELFMERKPVAFELIAQDPSAFYGFAVRGEPTTWNPLESVVELTVVCRGDTLTFESAAWYFTDEYQTALYSTANLNGTLAVPSDRVRLLCTKAGNPVVFARFPFTCDPSAVVSCRARGVERR